MACVRFTCPVLFVLPWLALVCWVAPERYVVTDGVMVSSLDALVVWVPVAVRLPDESRPEESLCAFVQCVTSLILVVSCRFSPVEVVEPLVMAPVVDCP